MFPQKKQIQTQIQSQTQTQLQTQKQTDSNPDSNPDSSSLLLSPDLLFFPPFNLLLLESPVECAFVFGLEFWFWAESRSVLLCLFLF